MPTPDNCSEENPGRKEHLKFSSLSLDFCLSSLLQNAWLDAFQQICERTHNDREIINAMGHFLFGTLIFFDLILRGSLRFLLFPPKPSLLRIKHPITLQASQYGKPWGTPPGSTLNQLVPSCNHLVPGWNFLVPGWNSLVVWWIWQVSNLQSFFFPKILG